MKKSILERHGRRLFIAGMGVIAMLGSVTVNASATQASYVYVSSNVMGPPTVERAEPAALSVFAFDPKEGALRPIQQLNGPSPTWIALHPSQRFLFACYSLRGTDRPRMALVESYAIDPASGKLTLLDRQTLDAGTAQLAVAPDGRHLVLANYYYGDYAVLPISEDGRLGTVSSTLPGAPKDVPHGPHPRQDGSHPHAAVFDPSGRVIGAADLGTDTLHTLRLAGDRLEPVSEVSLAKGMGPRHIAFAHNGKALYAVGELDGKIVVLGYDMATGRIGKPLQTVNAYPNGFTGSPSAAELFVHPSGKFLYASDRASRSITSYGIDPASGTLSLIGSATQGLGAPNSFGIDPSGQWLYAPASDGNSVAQFRIDPATGVLTPTGRVTPVQAPNVMVFREAR